MKLRCRINNHRWGQWHRHGNASPFIWTYPFWHGSWSRPEGAERHCLDCGLTESTPPNDSPLDHLGHKIKHNEAI